MRNLKRLLSAALAMVMAMSVATVASAAVTTAEFSDAGDISYTEAVEVMSTLGVLEGYETGDFQPTGTLTREQAAKIIAYMLLGTENAEKLASNVSSFTDVAANRWSAGYINYCATNGIIAGNGDGTFSPDGKLTGYAFAKMLLGALGYKADVEGFTGLQWTLKVASVAAKAGLLNDIQNFSGNNEITREQASQMALNCIKATLVEYNGNTIDVTTGDSTVTIGNTKYEYVTSNNKNINQNIDDEANQEGTQSDYYTLQFGEQYFPGLVLDDDARDDFQRPSNEWTYNKETIGVYPVTADFTFTSQVAHTDDDATTKLKAMGLKNYKFYDAVGEAVVSTLDVTVNGATNPNGQLTSVDEIANYTDNGATVLVYNTTNGGNLITDVVVIRDQLVTIDKIGSNYVSLDEVEDPSNFLNYDAIQENIEDVKDGDAAYELLSGLKSGDKVVVTPLKEGTKYVVAAAYVPTTVTGKLTQVDLYSNKDQGQQERVSVVVGGETYKIAQWNKDFADLTADEIAATKGDVTLTLDANGNALLIEDVGATSNYMVVKEVNSSLVNNKIVSIIDGWDINGNEISLNVGTQNVTGVQKGEVIYYTSENTPSNADYRFEQNSTADGIYNVQTSGTYEIKASNNKLQMSNGSYYWIKSGIKFIYVNTDADDDVVSIEIKNGVQNVTNAELKVDLGGETAQAVLDTAGSSKDEVKVVVIKNESNDAISTNLLYIINKRSSQGVDGANQKWYTYDVAMNSEEGLKELTVTSYDDLSIGSFASYAAKENEYHSDFYDLKNHDQATKTTSTGIAVLKDVANKDEGLIEISSMTAMDGSNVLYSIEDLANATAANPVNILRVKNAEWVDRTGNDIDSIGDLFDEFNELKNENKTFELRVVFNDNAANDGFGNSTMVVVSKIVNKAGTQTIPNDTTWDGDYTLDGNITVNAGKTLTITGDLNLNGHTINGPGKYVVEGTLYMGSSIANSAVVEANSAVLLNDFTMASGTLTIKNDMKVASTAPSDAEVTLTSGTVEVKGSVSAPMIVNGGTLTVDVNLSAPVTVTNGTVTVKQNVSDVMTVEGGNVTVNGNVNADINVATGVANVTVDGKLNGEVIGGGSVTVGGEVVQATPYATITSVTIDSSTYTVNGDTFVSSAGVSSNELTVSNVANNAYVTLSVGPSSNVKVSVVVDGETLVAESNGSYKFQVIPGETVKVSITAKSNDKLKPMKDKTYSFTLTNIDEKK